MAQNSQVQTCKQYPLALLPVMCRAITFLMDSVWVPPCLPSCERGLELTYCSLKVSIWHGSSSGRAGCLWISHSPISLKTFPSESHTVAPCSRNENPDCFTKSLRLWTAQIWTGLFLALNTEMEFRPQKSVKFYHLSYLHLLDMVCYSANVGYIIEF